MDILSKLHVIAVSKWLNSYNEPDVFVYSNGEIYLYSPQWELDTSYTYDQKIKEIAMQADQGLVDWVDVWIDDGQEVTRQDGEIYVDNVKIVPFKRLSKNEFANIGVITTKIYNEFMRSREKEEEEIKGLLKECFDNGLFSKQISDVIEFNYQHPIELSDLNSLDKQIIVRTKVEGYDFIIRFIKKILHSGVPEKIEYCEIFLSRIFLLESQNFIKV